MLKLKKKVLKRAAWDIKYLCFQINSSGSISKCLSLVCEQNLQFFSQKQFTEKTFCFQTWRQNVNPSCKQEVTSLSLLPSCHLYKQSSCELTWGMMRDLLCHKCDAAFADPRNWSFWNWLLHDRREDFHHWHVHKYQMFPREVASMFKGF